jgi:hypothetical protein
MKTGKGKYRLRPHPPLLLPVDLVRRKPMEKERETEKVIS